VYLNHVQGDGMTSTRRAMAGALSAATLAAVLAACAVPVAGSATSGPAPVPASAPAPASTAGVATQPSVAPDPNAPEVVEAGDIPDNQVFVPYSPPGAGYTVSVPEGWARTDDQGATVFTDKFNSVRVETVARPGGAPDITTARSQELPAIAASAPGFVPGDVTAVNRAGGPVVRITYSATSPVDPVTGKAVLTAVERYEFWRAGQEVVLTLSGAKGADNVDPWRIVSDSFRWQG
jgi:hypothetical protein